MDMSDWLTPEERGLVARVISGSLKAGDVGLAGRLLGAAEASGDPRLVWLWGRVCQDAVGAFLAGPPDDWAVEAIWDTEGFQVGYKVVQRRPDGEEVVLKAFRLAGDVKLALSSGGEVGTICADSGETVLDGHYSRKLGSAVATACSRRAEEWAEHHLGPKRPPQPDGD